MNAAPVRLSIQIVTWNSADHIDACLASVAAQSSPHYELVAVDNASTDGTADRVAGWLQRGVRGELIRSGTNTGFCGGHNTAFLSSASDLVLFLNPDIVLPPDFVERAIRVADALPAEVGTIAPRILLPDGRIDSTGLIMDVLRRGWDRDHGAAEPTAAEGSDVFGCTGAAALHRRAMLRDVAIGGKPLDELIFAYYDDLDLAWRARLRGWRCHYEPALVVTHFRHARNALRGRTGRGTRTFDQVFTVRNRLLMIVKCERARDAVLRFPLYATFELARVAYLATRAPRVLSAYAQFAAALPAAITARRRIHRLGPRGQTEPAPIAVEN